MRLLRTNGLEGVSQIGPRTQAGRNLFVYKGGPHLQDGHGIFSTLLRGITGLFRRAAPVVRRAVSSQAVQDIGKSVAEHGASAAASAVADLVEGSSPGPGVKRKLKSARKDIAKTIRGAYSTEVDPKAVWHTDDEMSTDSDEPVLFEKDEYGYSRSGKRKSRLTKAEIKARRKKKKKMSRAEYLQSINAKKPSKAERKEYGRF